ncbi:MAG: hypothetical protein IPK68_10665 [Bdellovibrionales bacterium]|nr:hypothetical protein [Bdellovibrionales bacterium]
MKYIYGFFSALLILAASYRAAARPAGEHSDSNPSNSTPKIFQCKYESGDVGTIIGRGATASEAFADASEKCFERRVSIYEKIRGKHVDEERGLDFIDSCVNLSCG